MNGGMFQALTVVTVTWCDEDMSRVVRNIEARVSNVDV